jgi:hypothetical protein
MKSRQPDAPVGTFSFEEVEVEAFVSDGVWHLRSARHEVSGGHLGEATRALFNPQFHERTRSLIAEILDRHASVEAGVATCHAGADFRSRALSRFHQKATRVALPPNNHGGPARCDAVQTEPEMVARWLRDSAPLPMKHPRRNRQRPRLQYANRINAASKRDTPRV